MISITVNRGLNNVMYFDTLNVIENSIEVKQQTLSSNVYIRHVDDLNDQFCIVRVANQNYQDCWKYMFDGNLFLIFLDKNL